MFDFEATKGEAVKRFDLAPLSGKTWQVDPDTGFLHADVAVTWVGVRRYRHPDGSITRELRRPGILDNNTSYERMPVTRGHPPEFLNDENVSNYQVGHTGDKFRTKSVNGYPTPFSRITITNKEVIKSILDNNRTQTSAGYKMVPAPPRPDEQVYDAEGNPLGYGVWMGPHGPEEYDLEHKSTYGNHQAVDIDAGRGGPSIGITLDSHDAVSDVASIQAVEIRQDAYVKYDRERNQYNVHQGNTGKLLRSFRTPEEAADYLDKVHQRTNPKRSNRGLRAQRRNKRIDMSAKTTVQTTLKVGEGDSSVLVGNYVLDGLSKDAAQAIDQWSSEAKESARLLQDRLDAAEGQVHVLQKKVDQLTGDVEERAKALDEARSHMPVVTVEDIQARMELIESAKRLLKKDALDDEMARMDSVELKRSVLCQYFDDASFKSAKPAAVDSGFDVLCREFIKKRDGSPARGSSVVSAGLPRTRGDSLRNGLEELADEIQARRDAEGD